MNACLSMVLVASALLGPLARAEGPVVREPAVAGMVCGDWVDLGLILADPAVQTCIVDVQQQGGTTLVTAVHGVQGGQDEACLWVGFYAFPSSILAHSIVTVPFHAEEME